MYIHSFPCKINIGTAAAYKILYKKYFQKHFGQNRGFAAFSLFFPPFASGI
jgi:hypothetical protein